MVAQRSFCGRRLPVLLTSLLSGISPATFFSLTNSLSEQKCLCNFLVAQNHRQIRLSAFYLTALHFLV